MGSLLENVRLEHRGDGRITSRWIFWKEGCEVNGNVSRSCPTAGFDLMVLHLRVLLPLGYSFIRRARHFLPGPFPLRGEGVPSTDPSTVFKKLLCLCFTVINRPRILITAVRRDRYATCRAILNSVRSGRRSVGHSAIPRHCVNCCGYVSSGDVLLCTWDFRFSRRRIWRWLSSEVLQRVVC
jgi:hypothetical protein